MTHYRINEGSMHENFLRSHSKIQFIGGGFGNGKTAAMCIKCLEVARAYPGANILLGRSTFPRLRDTLMKEFRKWCPGDWIKTFPTSENSSKTCTLINGTEINFRYVQQKGKGDDSGDTKSNLLSATYDAIFIDQIEDPEITHKDFLDLMGRLRGNTKLDPKYKSDMLGDVPLPLTGPRWFIVSANPTRNWIYKKLVKPVYDMRDGRFNEDLICLHDENGKIVFDDGKPIPLIELFEGSTYENKDNLGKDFIQLLESSYTGQMKKRFLLGEWAAYEGLVYDMYDPNEHIVQQQMMLNYFLHLVQLGVDVQIVESYDYGIAAQCCYLFAFTDPFGNLFVLDGFYEVGKTVEWQVDKIKEIRNKYGLAAYNGDIQADPSIFRRGAGGYTVVGQTVADLFWNNGAGVNMVRASNDIINGIAKVQSYMSPHKFHRNPFTGTTPGAFIYFSESLTFIDNEITEYIWHRDTTGETEDKPVDRRDHAMDALKYMFTHRPRVSEIKVNDYRKQAPYLRNWMEVDREEQVKGHRYAH